MLDVWQQLLVRPDTSLAAAACLKGQLLAMLSLLVDAVEAGTAQQAGLTPLAVATAVLRLLDFNQNIARWAAASEQHML